LKDELIRTMSLCGTASLRDIRAELLMPASLADGPVSAML